MKIEIIIAILIVIFCHSAFADDWPHFRKDVTHSAQSAETLQPPLSVKWKFMADDKILSSPAIFDNKVIFGSRDNHLYALDATTGIEQWKYTTQNWIDSSPAVADGLVYFTSRDGHLYCLNLEDGQLKWKYNTGGTDFSSPTVDRGIVFAGAGFPNKFFYALDARTGQEKWRRVTEQMVYSSAAVAGDYVYVGSNDSHIYGLQKDTGTVVWDYPTKGGIYFASPALDDNTLYMGSGDFDWSVYALKLDTGNLLWQHTFADQEITPTYISSAAVGKAELFIVSGYARQHLYCLNLTDGSQKWKATLGPSSRFGFSSSPVVTEYTVYVSSAKGTLNAYDIATGSLAWSYDLGADVLSSPAIANGILYIATQDGTLFAFE